LAGFAFAFFAELLRVLAVKGSCDDKKKKLLTAKFAKKAAKVAKET
jgi:hypothetical protein